MAKPGVEAERKPVTKIEAAQTIRYWLANNRTRASVWEMYALQPALLLAVKVLEEQSSIEANRGSASDGLDWQR